ncbi:MAG: type II secretion system protein [Candidatus Paceibacterota bacterium]|jgi:prepilin-type N-terminal cleavage/methylation domain-containing protein
MNPKKGFTLIELLVVVAIVGILAAVVMVALTSARNKGGDAGVKSNLRNAITQGEIFYNINTVVPSSYTNVCTNGPIGSPAVNGIGAQVLAAAKANGYASYATNAIGTTTTATCNNSANGWAAEVPLKSAGTNQMWCVDWTGKSLQTNGSTLSTSADVACN